MAIVLEIVADDKGLPVVKKITGELKKLDRQSEKTRKNQVSRLEKLNSIYSKNKLLIAGSVVAIGTMTVKMANMASAADETANKFDVVFKGVDNATDSIKEMRNETGFAVSSLQGMASSLGDLIKPAGFAADKAFVLSKKITKLSLDLGSFNNLKPQDVVRDFQSALAGSAETLTKYGIDVKEAAIAQEALNLGLIKSIKDYPKLDSATKRQVRVQALVSKAFKDSTDAIGDLARTQDSYANKTKVLSETTKELGESFGRLLVPSLTIAVDGLNNLVKSTTDAIEGLKEVSITEVIFSKAGFKTLASGFKNLLASGLNPTVAASMAIAENTEEWSAFMSEVEKKTESVKKKMDSVSNDTKKSAVSNVLSESDAKDLLARQQQQDDYTTFLANEAWERSELHKQATAEMLEETRIANEERVAIQTELDTRLNELSMNEFDLRRNQIEQSAELFRSAGVNELKIAEFVSKSKMKIWKQEGVVRLNTLSSMISGFQDLNTALKGNAVASKRLAQAGAIIDTYAGATKALAAGVPPWNFLAAAAVTTAGLANVARIESQGFADGGNVMVPGSGTGDRPYLINLEPKEMLQITPKDKVSEYGNGGTVYITNNYYFEDMSDDAIRNTVIPTINDAVTRNISKLYATKVLQ